MGGAGNTTLGPAKGVRLQSGSAPNMQPAKCAMLRCSIPYQPASRQLVPVPIHIFRAPGTRRSSAMGAAGKFGPEGPAFHQIRSCRSTLPDDLVDERTKTRALCSRHQLPPSVGAPQKIVGESVSLTMKRHCLDLILKSDVPITCGRGTGSTGSAAAEAVQFATSAAGCASTSSTA